MSKWTPGHWIVSEKSGDYIAIRHLNKEPGAITGNLALVAARMSWAEEGEANARLIAAAPEMAELLERLSVALHHCEEQGADLSGEDDQAWLDATELLLRIRGEQ